MTSVFSKVKADVAAEFVGKFPDHFDFLGMLQRVSEEAGVSVKMSINRRFTLEGHWSPIGRVHDILASTLAVYGATGTFREHGSKEIRKQDSSCERNRSISTATENEIVSPLKKLHIIRPKRHRQSLARQARRGPVVENEKEEEVNANDCLVMNKTDDDENVKDAFKKDLDNSKEIAQGNEDDDDNVEYSKLKTQISDICFALNKDVNDHDGLVMKKENNEIIEEEKSDNENPKSSYEAKLTDKSVVNRNCDSGVDNGKTQQRRRGRPRKETKLSNIRSRIKPKMFCLKFDSFGSKLHKKCLSDYRLKYKEKMSDADCSDLEGKSNKKKRGRPKKDPSDVQQEFPCKQCDFIGKNRNSLGDHCHRIHFASPTKCDICDKVFPNLRYMKRHRASHVSPQHVCDICGKMYKVLKALRNHRQTHEDGYTKPEFACTQCSKSYCSQFILDCHVKAEHEGQKRKFLCSTCGKSFTTKHTLVQHYNVHSGARPYTCEVCGKGFRYESALRDHKFTHSQVRKFECLICLKKFRQRSAMKMHEKIHREEKDFTCAECGRGFTQKQALQRHVRAHKGFKPFVCKICGRGFGDSSIIRRHMICVHRINKDIKTWREDIEAREKQDEEFQNESTVVRDHSYVQPTDGSSDSVPETLPITPTKESDYPAMQLENNVVMNLSDGYKREMDIQAMPMNGMAHSVNDVSVSESPATSVSVSSVQHQHSLSLPQHQQDLDIPHHHPNHLHQTGEDLGASMYNVDSSQQQTMDYANPQNLQEEHHHDVNRYASYSINSSLTHETAQNMSVSLPSDHSYHNTPSSDSSQQQSSLPRVDSVLSKRLNEMEPPENLSISSLYAYYTNLASQYINASQYPGYIPTAGNSSSSQEN